MLKLQIKDSWEAETLISSALHLMGLCPLTLWKGMVHSKSLNLNVNHTSKNSFTATPTEVCDKDLGNNLAKLTNKINHIPDI